MRVLATEKYGCVEFKSVSDGGAGNRYFILASLKHIENWKNDPESIKAPVLGQQRWYSGYKVQVAKIEREYEKSTLQIEQ